MCPSNKVKYSGKSNAKFFPLIKFRSNSFYFSPTPIPSMDEFDPFKDYFQLSKIFWNRRASSSISSTLPFTSIKRRDLKFESRQYLLSEKLLVDVDIKFKKRSPSEEFKIKNISQESYSKHDVSDDNDCHDDGDSIKNKKNNCHSRASNEPHKLRDCAFCRKNGEQKQFYTTHSLKDQKGNVTCPVLQKYVCPSCGATGLTAHTKLYCPYEKHYISPVVSHLTPRMSSGKRRTKFQL